MFYLWNNMVIGIAGGGVIMNRTLKKNVINVVVNETDRTPMSLEFQENAINYFIDGNGNLGYKIRVDEFFLKPFILGGYSLSQSIYIGNSIYTGLGCQIGMDLYEDAFVFVEGGGVFSWIKNTQYNLKLPTGKEKQKNTPPYAQNNDANLTRVVIPFVGGGVGFSLKYNVTLTCQYRCMVSVNDVETPKNDFYKTQAQTGPFSLPGAQLPINFPMKLFSHFLLVGLSIDFKRG